MNRLLLSFALALLPFLLPAEEMFSVDKNGVLCVEKDCKLRFYVNYKSKKSPYSVFTQSPYYRYQPKFERKGSITVVRSSLLKENGPASEIIYRQQSPNKMEINYLISYPAGFRLNNAYAEFCMPISKMNGKIIDYENKKFIFPAELNRKRGFSFGAIKNASAINIPLSNGVLTVSFSTKCSKIQLRDGRYFGKWNQNYNCMMEMNKIQGQSKLSLTIVYTPYVNKPLSLKSVANRTFSDSIAYDKKGGWTDQGPEQDMSPLRAGSLKISPTCFDIASDRNGNSCLVLGGGGLKQLKTKAQLDLNNDTAVGSIFLLHSIAWAPKGKKEIGKLQVAYSDETKSEFPVSNQVEVGNWWKPNCSFKNGRLAWKDQILCQGELCDIGLFLSVFHPDPKKRVKSLTLISNSTSVWMIAGITVSPQKIALARESSVEFKMKRSSTWKPYTPCLQVEPGSALDFSFIQDAPSGKYGRIIVRKDGNYCFEKSPEKVFRLWGTNLCYSTSMRDKTDAETIVKSIKAFGYNAVRLHHFDRILCGWNNMTSQIKPELLDNFHYTISLLHNAGIYYTIDLFTQRSFDIRKVPGISWNKNKTYFKPRLKDEYSLAAILLPSVRNDLKQFAKNLLLAPNPYTGMAMKDDPGLVSISILNEDSILGCINHPHSIIKELYLKAFDQYVSKNRLKIDQGNHALEFRRFLLKVYDEYYTDMVHFLRNEIGTKALLSDQNFIGYTNLTFQRLKYDLVDEHAYCRPSMPLRMISMNAGVRRVFGKPFQISEFNFAYPAPMRSEGGLIYPAVAALQDWNGLYRFCHANRRDFFFSPSTGLEKWDLVNDPVRNIPERIAGMLFLRRDLTPLQDCVVTVVGFESSLREIKKYPAECSSFLFSAKTGSCAIAPNGKSFLNPLPKHTTAIINLDPKFHPDNLNIPVMNVNDMPVLSAFAKKKNYAMHLNSDHVKSATGELSADFKDGMFKVITPKTEGFYFTKAGTQTGKKLIAHSDSPSMIAATSLDNKILPQSSRVLLIHVTDMQNEGTVYTNKTMSVVMKSVHKNKPVKILFRNAQAKISFETELKNPSLYALDCSGKRIGSIKYAKDGKRIIFTANTDYSGIACFAYELTREKANR